MKKFAVIFLVLVYGCSYYLYNEDMKSTAQNIFNTNFDQPIKVTGVSFSPLAPICLSHSTIIAVESKGKTAAVPVSVSGCWIFSDAYVQMNSLYALKLSLSGF